MEDLKIINLQDGDSQDDVARKLNYNFQRIIELSGGAHGAIGNNGPFGADGDLGLTGPYGEQGIKGNAWFISPFEPSAGITAGDYWINTTKECEVYKYELTSSGLSWVDQYFYISKAGVFEISDYQTGLTSGSPSMAYVQNLFLPDRKTLVINAATGADIKNPQLTKMVVGNTGATGSILIEFSKGLYNLSSTDLTPKIRWTSTNSMGQGNYGLDFEVPEGFSVRSRNIDLSSTGALIARAGTTDVNLGVIGLTFSNDIKFISQNSTIKLYSEEINIDTSNFDFNPSGMTSRTSFRSTYTPVFVINRTINLLLTAKGATYSRAKSSSPNENLLRVKYNGEGSAPNLNTEVDHLVVTSGGEFKMNRKFSPWIQPGPSVPATNNTGTYNASFAGIAGADFFTIIPTYSTYTGVLDVNRYSMGDIFFPEIGSSHFTFNKALCISVSSDLKEGFSAIIAKGESLTFSVVAAGGFNAIILDVRTGNTPSSSFSFTAADTEFSLIDNETPSSTVGADIIELSIFRVDVSKWEVYYTAHATDDGTFCGVVYN